MVNWFKAKWNKSTAEQEVPLLEPKEIALHEAVSQVRNAINDGIEEKDQIALDMDRALLGHTDGITAMKNRIETCIKILGITVPEYPYESLIEYIFAENWGLGPIEKYYHQENVIEIRGNRPDQIKIKYLGGTIVNLPPEDCFRDDEAMERVIKNMAHGDTGESLDSSTGKMECVRPDGSRLTATCAPITKGWTFVLRKHTAFIPTKQSYIDFRTMDEAVWNIHKLLCRARVNRLYLGNVESGKTTLLRAGLPFMHEKLRILSLGRDIEVRITDFLPDRDVWEAEEHPQIGVMMEELLHLALREGGDVLIMEEFRNAAEAVATLDALTRGMYGSASTGHFNSEEEGVEGIARLLLKDGITLPRDDARVWVARAFMTILQLEGDSVSGRKLLKGITELYVKDDQVIFNKLVKWQPSSDAYFGEGKWVLVNPPSEEMIRHMLKTVSVKEIEAVGWKAGNR